MKIAWLEKLAAEGHVSAEAVERIYADCRETLESPLCKTAEFSMLMHQMLPNIAMMGVVGLGAMGIGAAAEAYGDARLKAAIDVNRKKIVEHPELEPKDKEKAEARFNEILKYAPHLGANEAVMTRLVHSKMHSGLSDKDVQGLVSLQLQMKPDPLGHTKMASDAPALCGEYLANTLIEFQKAASGQPLMRSLVGHALRTVAPMAALGAGIAGVGYIKGKVDEKILNNRLSEVYRGIMNSSEESLLQENPQRAHEAFKTLVHFAPHVAAEPGAAKAFMLKIVGYGLGPAASDIKDLASIEKDMRGDSAPFGILGTAMAGVGMPSVLASTWKDVNAHHSQVQSRSQRGLGVI